MSLNPSIIHTVRRILALYPDGITGKELRVKLNNRGFWKSGPGFYLLMSELEDAGIVKRNIIHETIEGETIQTHTFHIP